MSEKIEIQKKPMQRSQDEQLKEAIQKLEGFVDIKEVDEWEYFFFRQEMEIVYREEFLYKWAEILSGMKLSKKMYRFVNDKFDDIEKYCIENQKKPGEIASVRYARDKIKASYMRNGEGHLKEVLKENGLNVLAFLRSNKKRIIVISIQVVLMTIPLILQYMEQKEQEEEERIKENFQMMIEQDVSGLAAQANSYKLENVAKEAVTVRDGIYLKKWGPQLQSEEVGYREITDIREIGTVDGRSLKDKEYYALKIWGERKLNCKYNIL